MAFRIKSRKQRVQQRKMKKAARVCKGKLKKGGKWIGGWSQKKWAKCIGQQMKKS